MAGARAYRMAPRKFAEAIEAKLDLSGTYFTRCEIAGPGFLNFFLSPRFYADVLRDVEQEGEAYGRSDYGKGEKIMVEFVSANPTGPMHWATPAAARWATAWPPCSRRRATMCGASFT